VLNKYFAWTNLIIIESSNIMFPVSNNSSGQKKRRKSNFYSVDNAQKNNATRPSKGATKSVLDANAGFVRFSSHIQVPHARGADF